MKNTVHLIVVDGKKIVDTASLSAEVSGTPKHIKAIRGGKYLLSAEDNQPAPDNIRVKRVGKDLHVFTQEGDETPELIIDGFYDQQGELAGMGTDGNYHTYVSQGSDQDAFLILEDGSVSPLLLGSETTSGLEGLSLTGGLSAGMIAVGALAALAALTGIALAAGGGGGGGDSGNADGNGQPVEATVPADAIATDNVGAVTGVITQGNSTDDTRPVVTGLGTPGHVVRIYDNGELIGSTTVGSDGRWQWQSDTKLTEGAHSLSFSEVNLGGVESAKSSPINFDVDTTAPDVPAGKLQDGNGLDLSTGGLSNSDEMTMSGSGATPGDVVKLYDGDTVIGSAVVGDDGNWNVSGPVSGDGQHELGASFTDPAGNESAKSGPVVIDLDTTAPDAPVGQLQDGNGLDLSAGGLTTNDEMNMSGSGATPGDVVKLYDGDTVIGSTVVEADGSWSVTAPVNGDGTHELGASFTDPAGNESAKSGPIVVDLDTTAPDAPVGQLQDGNGLDLSTGGLTNSDEMTLSGNDGVPGDVVKLYDGDTLIGSAVVEDDGSWSVTGPVSGDGTHELGASFTDPAGNESARTAPIIVDLDTSAPDAPVGQLQDGNGLDLSAGGLTNNGEMTMSGNDGVPGDVVKLYDGDTVIGSAVVEDDGSWSVTGPVSGDGTHELGASFTDPAGNESARTAPITIDLDTTAPDAPVGQLQDGNGLDLSAGGLTNSDEMTLSGNGGIEGDVVKLYDGDTLIGSAVVEADGSWSVTAPVSGDGPHNLSSSLTDPAGNESAKSTPIVVELDTTAPDAPVGQLQDGNGLDLSTGGLTNSDEMTLSGNDGVPGDVVKLYDGDTLIGSAVVEDDGSWSVTGPVSGDGTHELGASFTDPAGNESARTVPIIVDLDTSAPDAPVGQLQDGNGLDLSSGGLTNNDEMTMSGNDGVPGDVVKLYDGDTLIGSAVVEEDGSWSVTGPMSGDGTHELGASFTDPAGNESARTAPIIVDLDTSAPDAPVGQLQDGNGLDLSAGGLTNSDEMTLSGNGGIEGDVVKLYDGDTLIGSAVVEDDGSWSVTGPVSGDGTHELGASFTDPAGNESARTAPIIVDLDTSAPDAPVGQLQDGNGLDLSSGGLTNSDEMTMSGNDGVPGDVVKLYDGDTLIGSAVVEEDGSWSVTGPMSGDGTHELGASFTDPAGNESARTAPIIVDLDTSAPDAPVGQLQDGNGLDLSAGGLTNNGEMTLRGNGGMQGEIVKLYDGNTLIGSAVVEADGSWSVTALVSGDGPHNLSSSLTDPAGNESAKSTPIVVELDTTAPDAPVGQLQDGNGLDLSAGGLTNSDEMTLSGNDGVPGDVVKLYDGDTLIGSAVVEDDGSWSVSGPVSGDGAHELGASFTDPAGNESARTAPIIVDLDTSAPDAPVGQLQDGNGLDLSAGGLTNNGEMTLRGNGGTQGEIVKLYDGDTVIGSAVVEEDGSWSVTGPVSGDGTHELGASFTDPAGNESARTAPITVDLDTTAPDAPVGQLQDGNGLDLSAGGLTNSDEMTLSGNGGIEGDVVKLYDGDTLIGSAVVEADGSWSVTAPVSGDGTHNLSASLTDPAGNESAKSAPIVIELDTTAPDAPVGQLQDGNGLDLSAGGLTNSDEMTLSGNDGVPGDVVKLYDGDTLIGSAVVEDDGSWSVSGPVSGDGAHELGASFTDPAGNESARTAPIIVDLDTSAPDAPVGQLQDGNGLDLSAGGLTNNGEMTLRGNGGTQGEIVKLYDGDTVIGSAVVEEDGSWSVTGPVSGDGTHELGASFTDPAGNESARTAPITVDLDTTAPDAPVGQLQDGNGLDLSAGGLTNSDEMTLSGNGGIEGDVVKLYDGDTLIGSAVVEADGSWSVTAPVSGDGTHNLSASLTDPAGNESAKSAPIVIELDTTAPDAPVGQLQDGNGLDLSAGGLTNNGEMTLRGNGGTQGEIVKLYDGSTLIGSAVVEADGSWSVTAPVSGDGTHNLSASLTDPAGNESAKSTPIVVYLDTTAPDAPVGQLQDGNGLDLSAGGLTNNGEMTLRGNGGTQGEIVKLYDGNTLIGSAVVEADGSWSVTAPVSDDGTHNLSASLTDPAGNESAKSAPIVVELDTEAPTSTLVLVDNEPTLAGETEANAIVFIRVGNVDLGSVQADSSGNWSWKPRFPALDGHYNFNVRVQDAVGNISEPTNSVGFGVATTVNDFNDTTGQGWTISDKFGVSSAFNGTNFSARYQAGVDMRGEIMFREIEVKAGHSYTFSYADSSFGADGANQPQVGFMVNGVYVIPIQSVAGNGSPVGIWIAEETGVVRIAVMSGSVSNNNSLTIDNFSMREAGPEVATLDTLGVQNDDSDHFQLTGGEYHLIDDEAVLNLSDLAQQHQEQAQDIHAISLEGHGNNTLNVSIDDVLALGGEDVFLQDGNKQLIINGDAGDVVNLEAKLGEQTQEQWNAQGQVTHDGTIYNVYQNSGHDVEVLIQQEVQTNL